MFAVKVYSPKRRVTVYLNFETYYTATACYHTLTGRPTGRQQPDTYFSTAVITRELDVELINREAIKTNLVNRYLRKTQKRL